MTTRSTMPPTTCSIYRGGVGGPGDPGAKGEGGSLAITDLTGAAVSQLHYVGSTTHDGVTYYAYGLVGTTAHTSDIHFG